MGQDMLPSDAHLVTVCDEGINLLLGIRLSLPLALILEKESEGTCAQFASTQWRLLHATCSAHMRSDIFIRMFGVAHDENG